MLCVVTLVIFLLFLDTIPVFIMILTVLFLTDVVSSCPPFCEKLFDIFVV